MQHISFCLYKNILDSAEIMDIEHPVINIVSKNLYKVFFLFTQFSVKNFG